MALFLGGGGGCLTSPQPAALARLRQPGTKSLFLSKADVSKGLGIVLKGDAPVSICEVECDGPSWIGGLRVDDVFTSVNGTPCVNSSHKTVIALVSKALQKLQSEDDQDHRGVRGHAMSMVVTAQDARPDAAISDVNISLPGQAWGDDDAGGGGSKAGDGADDPFAPIREAASQHQLEAVQRLEARTWERAPCLARRMTPQSPAPCSKASAPCDTERALLGTCRRADLVFACDPIFAPVAQRRPG